MASSFDNLLSSIGFGAADASAESGLIQRKLELGKNMVGMDAEDSRRELSADLEGRGVYSSGEANLGFARLEANTANQLSQLDIAAADSTLSVQRQLEKDKAAAEAEQRAIALQERLGQQQYDLSRSQFAASNELQRQTVAAQQAARDAAIRGSSVVPAGMDPSDYWNRYFGLG